LGTPAGRAAASAAKALCALDILSDGRVIAGLGPGSSRADYEAVGVPFEERWQRFDETIRLLKALLQPGAPSASGTYYSAPAARLSPSPRQSRGIPLWIGSWGSQAGLRRVACLGDGWLASAYNTTPEAFAVNMKLLGGELERRNRPADDFPNALVTMWAWITDKRSDGERVLSEIVGPLVKRDPAEQCAELPSRYARAGCQRVHFWPVGDERRQVELIAGEAEGDDCAAPHSPGRFGTMKKLLELLVCFIHPLAVVLMWIDLASRRDMASGPKLAWAILGLIPLVPFLYVLTGGDLW